jgi:hypothetical protein
MKKILITIVLISGILLSNACTTVRTTGNSGKVPPGQAKKARGSKSARAYAPGQQKKH